MAESIICKFYFCVSLSCISKKNKVNKHGEKWRCMISGSGERSVGRVPESAGSGRVMQHVLLVTSRFFVDRSGTCKMSQVLLEIKKKRKIQNTASDHNICCNHVKVFVSTCCSTNLVWRSNTVWEKSWRSRIQLLRIAQRWWNCRLHGDTLWSPWRGGSCHQLTGTFWIMDRCLWHQIWPRRAKIKMWRLTHTCLRSECKEQHICVWNDLSWYCTKH